MTKVLYRKYYGNDLIVIEGHSGFDTVGKDIVCAAVSTVVCTLINCLHDEHSDERIKLVREVVNPGYVCFEVESFDFATERIKGVLDAVFTGFSMLADVYPNYISIE